MQKLVETINNLVKLITSLVTLGVLGGVIFGGLWAYHKVAELTSKPIQFPTVKLPEIKLPEVKVGMPEIKVGLPEIEMPDVAGALGRAADKLTGNDEKDLEPGWNFDRRKRSSSPSGGGGWDFNP